MNIHKGQQLWCKDGTRAVVQDVSDTHIFVWYKGEIVKHTIDMIGKMLFIDKNFPRKISLAEFSSVILKQKEIKADEETQRNAKQCSKKSSKPPTNHKISVKIGDLVSFIYLDTGETCAYTIIDPTTKKVFVKMSGPYRKGFYRDEVVSNSDTVAGTISAGSQLGKALLGKEKGDVFKFEAVSELRQIKIIDFHSVAI